MASDFIEGILYSCGHYKDYGWGVSSMGNYPCPKCKAKGINSVTSTHFDPAYTVLHPYRTLLGKKRDVGTWERLERPADWMDQLMKHLWGK